MLEDTSPPNTELELSVTTPEKISHMPALLERLHPILTASIFENNLRANAKSFVPLFDRCRKYASAIITEMVNNIEAIDEVNLWSNAGSNSASPKKTGTLSLSPKKGRNNKVLVK